MQFENDAMVFLFAGRTAANGYNVETEIIGTKGALRIASVPQKNLVEILDTNGVVRECSQNFLERFEQAYLNEVQEFVNCIKENRQPEVSVTDGTKATRIAYQATESFRENKLIKN
jgi:myo-inositol 2-dehydrogenase/D-chiro-inositol 1-dehydrogenase